MLIRVPAPIVLAIAGTVLSAAFLGSMVVYAPALAVGLISLPMLLSVPWLPLLVAILLQGARSMVIDLLGVESGQVTLVQSALVATAAAGALARMPNRPFRGALVALGFLAVLVSPGFLFPSLGQPLATRILGVFFLAAPIVASLVGYVTSARAVRVVAMAGAALLAVNALESVRQFSVGTEALVSEGAIYGTNVREIDGRLRTFGLMVTNADLGNLAAAAVLFPAASRVAGRPLPRWIEMLTYVSAATNVYLSTSRSSLVFLTVSILLVAGHGIRRNRTAARVTAAVMVAGLAYAFVQAGAGTADSTLARLDVWRGLLEAYGSFFGLGPGAVGAASYSSTNDQGASVFVDNSWLSIYLQYGYLGTIMAILCLVEVLRRGRALAKVPRGLAASRLVVAIAVAVGLTAMTVEFVDYVAPMLICGFCVGVAFASVRNVSLDDRAERTGVRGSEK